MIYLKENQASVHIFTPTDTASTAALFQTYTDNHELNRANRNYATICLSSWKRIDDDKYG